MTCRIHDENKRTSCQHFFSARPLSHTSISSKMRTQRPSLYHALLLICLSPSSVKAFSPVPSVRLTPIVKLPPLKLLSSPHFASDTRTCRRHHQRRHDSTRLYLTPSASLSWWYMSLLALQFGCQPILTKKFVPKTTTRSTVVLLQEVVKFTAAATFLWASGSWATSLSGT